MLDAQYLTQSYYQSAKIHMAHILLMGGATILDGPVASIANVDFAVGPKALGGQNTVSDVQLVQFLLHFLVTEVPDVKLRDRNGLRIRTVPITGIFDARTFDAVKGFQLFVRDSFAVGGKKASIFPDGVVNASNSAGISTISGTIYTIVWLNLMREGATGQPMGPEQVSIEPLATALQDVRTSGGGGLSPFPPNPHPLPPPPPPPLGS